jgi:hypothetical protein
MRTRHLLAIGAAGLLAVGVLAGCANGANRTASPGGSMTPSTSPSSASSPSSPSSEPSPSLSSALSLPPAKPPATGVQQTLTGQVEDGVERGCLILRDAGGTGTYQLVGADTKVVYVGARVSVTGHVVTGMMSYCMQGKMFQVTSARAAP